jgi:TonB family protein
MSEFRTALSPERQPLVGYVGCSVLIHLGVVGMAFVTPLGAMVMSAFLPSCGEPPIRETIEVSMVSLPKSDKKVPDRATRVKAATGKEAVKEPPPIKESDLKIKKEEPDPGNAEEARRQELLEEIERRRLLAELEGAMDGPRDRDPTDPNGTAESLENAVLGAQAQGDPEFARWAKQVEAAVQANFHPLGDAGDVVCKVSIRVDPETGQIESHEVIGSSGILAFDAAAERAVQDTASVPLPPEKYRGLVAREGFAIRLYAK